MDYEALETSCLSKSKGKRTVIFYAHPYSSWERGSNENVNGIIRRFIPKGSNMSHYSKKDISEIEDWINAYPRRIIGGLSASMAAESWLAS